MIANYRHLVEIEEVTRRLAIFRIYDDGRKELFTFVDLPLLPADQGEESLAEFCRLLGENLLLDSPAGRKLMGL